MPELFRSGFVSILGRPNAGKSTLLNALVGTKLAIVADKPQTTRTTIQGVLTLPDAQVVFLDTPGIHKADSPINKRMMNSIRGALDERDLLLYVVDATVMPGEPDRQALDLLQRATAPAVLVANKIDLAEPKGRLLPVLEAYRSLRDFAEYVPVSAMTGEGLDLLRPAILTRLPEGPAYFPPDHITDQPERFLVSELIREKLLLLTRQEVPHSVAVVVDKWEDEPRLTRVLATIFVEKEGQKGIVIGARGSMLKEVGTQARAEIEALMGRKFYLALHVKVRRGWRDNDAFLNTLDWRTMAGSDET